MTQSSTDEATPRTDSIDDLSVPNRRQFLAALSAATTIGLAGCSGGGNDGTGGNGGGSPASGNESPGPEHTDPPSADCEGVTISENVTTDTTWSVEDCPVVVLEFNIGVTEGATLTIDPGVQVVAKGNTSLTVESDGTLKALGEPSNPVWFYGETADPDLWRGLIVKSDGDNRVDNAVIRHAGFNSNAAVYIQGDGQLSMTNTLVADCAGPGMLVDGTIGTFEFNAFRNNGSIPIELRPPQLDALDAGSTYAGGNGDDTILVPFGTVENEATWAATDAPYRFHGRCSLAAPVTIEPGAKLAFAQDGQLFLDSGVSFTAEGTPKATIVFEGDPAEPGIWRGIILEGDATTSVDNAEIAHSGGDGNLTLNDQSSATVTNSLLRASTGYGIYVDDDATLDQSNNTFENNAEGAVGGPGA